MKNTVACRPFPVSLFGDRDWVSDFLKGVMTPSAGEGMGKLSPAVDVTETPESFVIRAELPGVSPEAINITLTGDTLTIRGEKTTETTQEKNQAHVVERTYGSFARSFTFPTPVESDAVEAESSHGVLTVKVHKAKESRPRQITVKAR